MATDAPKPLDTPDRLLVREAQLELTQAHIARLQAEAQVRVAEDRITRLVQTLKTQYACPDCQLNNDFTWTPAPAPAATAEAPKGQTPAPPKAPPKAGGQSSQKE
jgi:ribosomal protein L12E/L44/L45/RPP1/RPP2